MTGVSAGDEMQLVVYRALLQQTVVTPMYSVVERGLGLRPQTVWLARGRSSPTLPAYRIGKK